MKLSENEAIVKDFKIIEDCLGAKKTKTDVMITFTKDQKQFSYFDLFFTREQIIELRNDLNELIGVEFCAKLKTLDETMFEKADLIVTLYKPE